VTRRPSLRELLGVWLASMAAEILGWILVDDAGPMTVAVVLGGGLFILTPLFVVVYSVVWAWPWAAMGDRAAVSGLVVLAVMIQAVSGWFLVGVETITLTTIVIRLLAVFSPVVFVACAMSAAWAYRKRARSQSAAIGGAQDGAALPSLGSGREPGMDPHDAKEHKEVETARRLRV
jgi:hypothetical protein